MKTVKMQSFSNAYTGYTNRDAPFLLLTVLGNFISSYVFACWKLAPIALDSAYENTSA